MVASFLKKWAIFILFMAICFVIGINMLLVRSLNLSLLGLAVISLLFAVKFNITAK